MRVPGLSGNHGLVTTPRVKDGLLTVPGCGFDCATGDLEDGADDAVQSGAATGAARTTAAETRRIGRKDMETSSDELSRGRYVDGTEATLNVRWGPGSTAPTRDDTSRVVRCPGTRSSPSSLRAWVRARSTRSS